MRQRWVVGRGPGHKVHLATNAVHVKSPEGVARHDHASIMLENVAGPSILTCSSMPKAPNGFALARCRFALPSVFRLAIAAVEGRSSRRARASEPAVAPTTEPRGQRAAKGAALAATFDQAAASTG